MEEVYEFLKESEVFYVATIDGDQPRVRPFGTVIIFENKMYLQTGRLKNVSKQISVNNKVEICACKYGRWLRITAKLVEDDRVEPRQAMLDSYPMLKTMYSADDGNTQVFCLEDAIAEFSSVSYPPRIVQF